jgi:hypothetical protein
MMDYKRILINHFVKLMLVMETTDKSMIEKFFNWMNQPDNIVVPSSATPCL